MCILILKKKGAKFPSVKTIENSVKANPDGFSLTYNHNGVLVTQKTLNRAEYISAYKSIVATHDHNDTAMMLHMRIATHGSVNIKNCHCWDAQILGTEMAFAHNGVLSIQNRDDMTDSETFLRDYLEPSVSIAEFFENIDTYIGMSKFGFIDTDGNIFHFGQFVKDKGVLYSNLSFRNVSRMEADPRFWRAII